MATRSKLLYSAAAVRRMLDLSDSTPVQVREFFNAIWVWVKGTRPTFISKSDFKVHFVERRKAASVHLTITPWLYRRGRYTISNPRSGSSYVVDCFPDSLDCACEDYHWQQITFGKGCCKHGYAVLRHLEFDSLHDYVDYVDQHGFDAIGDRPAA
ncbi:MAG: hypothetical protein ACFE0J_04020 [Elainellaceae cyanobacterium]